MLQEELKKLYTQMFKDLELDETLEKALVAFIESYDGSNAAEFSEMVYQVATNLGDFKIAQIKAEAYEAMQEELEDSAIAKATIKTEFEQLQQGKLPIKAKRAPLAH